MVSGSHLDTPVLRADVAWASHGTYWVVQDPLANCFYRFDAFEYEAARLMNQRNSLAGIAQILAERYPDRGLDQNWLKRLVSRLSALDLLMLSENVGRQFHRRRHLGRRPSAWRERLLSPLAIRIPLFEPKYLATLRPLASILFHPVSVALAFFLAIGVGFLVWMRVMHSHSENLFNPYVMGGEQWILLLFAYLFAKSLHELGHGLACVARSVECTEVGLYLLCFTPCLYCDTTDAWKLKSRWQRAQIAVAGMYVEVWLAGVAGLVWLIAVDGLVRDVAGSLLIVCSVGTLLVNFNPLLKYDGYYILSDLWGVPNLSERSKREVQFALIRCLAGRDTDPGIDGSLGRSSSWPLILYGLLASIYRTAILGLVIWLVWSMLVPAGLGLAAIGITTVVTGMWLFQGAQVVKQFVRSLSSVGRVRWVRIVLVLVALGWSCSLLFTYPVPRFVRGRGVVDFGQRAAIYVPKQATVQAMVKDGTFLEKGETIAVFQSQELEWEQAQLEGELKETQRRIINLRQRTVIDELAPHQIPLEEAKLEQLGIQQAAIVGDLEQLQCSASFAGVFLSEMGELVSDLLPTNEVYSSPLAEDSNLGAAVQPADRLGWLVNNSQVMVRGAFETHEIRLLEPGMNVLVRSDRNPWGTPWHGKVVNISAERMQEIPETLRADFALAAVVSPNGGLEPVSDHYEVVVQIDDACVDNPNSPYFPALNGVVTVQAEVQPIPIVQQLVELVFRTVRPIY